VDRKVSYEEDDPAEIGDYIKQLTFKMVDMVC
jgi:hypothetical protein